jgi:hypothetical protein
MALLFEHKTCGRCGGSGKYSWCQMHGDTCFGCAGSGQQLTKKGKVAQAWFHAKKKKPACEVKVGERIVVEGCPGFSKSEVVIVEFVGWGDKPGWLDQKTGEWKPHFIVEGVGAKSGQKHGISGFEQSEIKMHVWGEALAALKKEALEFQASLTKDGKVSKRKIKKSSSDPLAV